MQYLIYFHISFSRLTVRLQNHTTCSMKVNTTLRPISFLQSGLEESAFMTTPGASEQPIVNYSIQPLTSSSEYAVQCF